MTKKKSKAAAAKPAAVKKTVKKSTVKPVVEKPVIAPVSEVKQVQEPVFSIEPEQAKTSVPFVQDKKKHNCALAGFIINIVLPGLGSLIGFGKEHRTPAVTQFLLFIVGLTFLAINGFIFGLIGWLLILIVWIWAVGLGIKVLKQNHN